MRSFTKTALAFGAALLLFSTPLLAAETTTPTAKTPAAMEKPDLGAGLKEKTSQYVEQTKEKVDNAADKLQESLGGKKDKAKSEIVDVDQKTVIVETPDGIAKETTTTIIPEGAVKTSPQTRTGK